MNEQYYEKLLNINTSAEASRVQKSFHYHRYEPTPYSALEVLFREYELNSSDRIVDFGCGKGRLNFLIKRLFNSSVVGVEMNELFYKAALENRRSYLEKDKQAGEKIQFYCGLAEEYIVNPLDNCFYFFNPFSIQVFIKVINNILTSVEETSRTVEIVLYYPSEDYIYYLENYTSFVLKKEVRLEELYEQNPNERFLIYHLTY
ncbi:class I SAM-dependent methyltransferase [Anaerobacillus alkaliphilus]|uniref:Class I SAM-dependent methyltransferase n=1 Tax=Anaerobacillus alkaliphilus TaxID=1548597 RepID=A0A4V1LGD2_9BACI|nr:class I SAM-dependent methyltransferase [Anaerobacillus alkaliphilus]RXJ00352.1 class I SAM-dependent methyltransferase [Anaerobacillus alkaliphilus]